MLTMECIRTLAIVDCILTKTLPTMTPLTAKVGDGKAEELWKLSQKYAACKSREGPNPSPKPYLNAKP